jgi:ribosomal protein L32
MARRRKVVRASPTTQYRCQNCGTFSPHDKTCFFCGCTQKERIIGVPEAQKPTGVSKGWGINVAVR